jgi:hypothetical protein
MTLADYISTTYPQIKSQLAWSDSVTLPAIVAATLELYGVTLEADATDSRKLHALAAVATWQQALNDISLDIAFSADGASFSRNQAVDAVRKNLASAEVAAMSYLPGYAVTVHPDDSNADWVSSE